MNYYKKFISIQKIVICFNVLLLTLTFSSCGFEQDEIIDALLLESKTGENSQTTVASIDPSATKPQKVQTPTENLVAGAFAIFPEGAFIKGTPSFTVSLAPGTQDITKQVIEDLKGVQKDITLEKYFPSVAISSSKEVKLKPTKAFELALPILEDLAASLDLVKDTARYAVFYQLYNHDTKKIMSGIKLRSSVYFYSEDENFLILQSEYFGVYQAAFLSQDSYDKIKADIKAESNLTKLKTKFDKEIYTTVQDIIITKETKTTGDEETTPPQGPVDTDGDGVADNTDNCTSLSNPGQENIDGDGKGDLCDLDKDGDSVANSEDAFPSDANETLDSDGDGVGNNSDNCPNTANPNQADSNNDGKGDACPTNTYEENFVNGQAATAQCEVWKDWIPTLEQNHTKVTFSSSEDETGVVCDDPEIVNDLADAIKNKTNFDQTCNGKQWTLCGTRYQGELWIDPPSLCSGSNCPNPGWIMRPCIGGNNSNWGGGNTATCGGVNQSMKLKFE